MIENIWSTIRDFWVNHIQHQWLEYLLIYVAIGGLCIALLIRLCKMCKEDKKLNQESIKTERTILKILGKFKNKNK